jgi:hypothetical protein
MAIPARAGQVLTDLGIAVGHRVTSGWAGLAGKTRESCSHWLAGAKASRLSRKVAVHDNATNLDHSTQAN